MRLTGTRAYYRPTPPKMPPGLVELMEGLTKEVLKHNPSDIYGFCAGHVEQLLEKRDGPSNKKILSLEKKIVRAQKKVRQRAEKRRQEYDKELLLLNPSSNDNDELTLHVPQLNTKPNASTTIDEENAPTSTDAIDQNGLKAPVHQEYALENSSEVEISHESEAPSMQTGESVPMQSDKPSDKDEIDNINNSSSKNNTGAEINANGAQSGNETDEHQINTDISSNNFLDNESKNDHENNYETEVAKSIENEQSAMKHVNVEADQRELDIADTILTNSMADEKNLKDIKKEDGVSGVVESEKTSNDMDDKQVLNNSTENKNSHDILNAAEQAESSTQDISSSDHVPDTSTNANQKQDTNKEVSHVEEIRLANNAENLKILDNIQHVQTGDLSPALNSEVSGDLASSNDNTTAINGKSTEPFIDSTNGTVDNKQTVNTEKQQSESMGAKEETGDTKQAAILETEIHELPSADVDKDISTLVTEDAINNENQENKAKMAILHSNDTEMCSLGDTPSSQVEKCEESTVQAKVASKNENVNDSTRLDTVDNSTDSTVHFSSTEVQGKGETSDNMSEITRNDSHDPSNMDLETAAITIQKVFRTFLFKSRGSTFEDTGNDEGNFFDEDDKNKEECDFPIASALNIDRRAHGITRMDTVLQTVNEEKSLSLSDDSSTLSSAATIIQAHVRGFLVRNKLNSYKTVSTNSLPASNSNDPSITSLDADNDQNKNRTVLNIHIVPEGENYLSRDESLITSMELSLDSSPPSSINLHPLGYDKSERRKQLKREDAIQSISPPSNNSGKLSEDLDSVKELSLNENDAVAEHLVVNNNYMQDDIGNGNGDNVAIEDSSVDVALNVSEEDANNIKNKMVESETHLQHKGKALIKMTSDEMDVITPFIPNEDSPLIHSGEFHDAVLPTRVSRSDTSVVSEFKNVLVYFLLWNHS